MVEEKNVEEREKKVNWLAGRLEQEFGSLDRNHPRSPVDTLIRTVLSQNTNDRNRDRAWEGLMNKFSGYEQIASAPIEDIADSIRSGGLQRQKAKAIKGIIERLKEERGEIELDYLKGLSVDEALSELKKFDGVGNKTAGVVLLFAFGKPYFPVDTHIRRVTSRLGLVRDGEGAHRTLNRLVPDDLKHQLHLHLIRHGRETCKARKPKCRECILRERCPTGKEKV